MSVAHARNHGLVLALAALGCAPTETGNPPAAPTIDPTMVRHEHIGIGEAPTLVGGAGAVVPGEGTVDVVSLSGAGEASTEVRPDGGFALALPSSGDDLYRVQVSSRAGRSDPVDFAIVGDTITPSMDASGGCVESSVGTWLEPAPPTTPSAVTITNHCETPAGLETAQVLGASADWTLEGVMAETIEPGATRTWMIRGVVGAERAVLVVPITGGPLLAITLTTP